MVELLPSFNNVIGAAYTIWQPFLGMAIGLFLHFWWLWTVLILGMLAHSTWMAWRHQVYKHHDQDWRILEIQVPRMTERDPKAMVQVLSHIHTLRNAAGDIKEYYWDGELTDWVALEMVSFGGEIRLYVRCVASRKDIIEASFFAHYPDIEVREVEDYINRIPSTVDEVYDQGAQMWGTEIVLSKEAAYPILSYEHFETPDEEKQLDPISTFLEILGKMKKGEFLGIQIIIAPAASSWKNRFNMVVKKMKHPQMAKEKDAATSMMRSMMIRRSVIEEETLKAVEDNLSQPAFETLLRFLYISPMQTYSETFARRGVTGAFNQYGTLHLNSFIRNEKMSTRARIWHWPHIFPKKRVEARKQRLLRNYRFRDIPEKTFMGKLITSHPFCFNFASRQFYMSLKSIATLFHPPMSGVLLAPYIKRVDSRRVAPPVGVVIYGEDGDIASFTQNNESNSSQKNIPKE